MNKKLFLIIIILFSTPVMAREFIPGLTFMAGGRYDDLRMCVGSPAGTKGGPIGDGMFSMKFYSPKSFDINLSIPILRPILFAAAFQMLQFEPEVSLEIKKEINSNVFLVTGPVLGVSLHYGPDYKSSIKNNDESFFAGGPIAGAFWGFRIFDKRKKSKP